MTGSAEGPLELLGLVVSEQKVGMDLVTVTARETCSHLDPEVVQGV